MFLSKPIVVVKFGSAVLADAEGKINKATIRKIANEIAALQKNYIPIMVSSGAVSSGKHFLTQYKGTITERKAAAAIGNPLLILLYQQFFSKHNITVAQALCERHHFSNRKQFVQLKSTFEEFWKNNIIPIVNENDLISNHELKFSDNDELATLLAIAFNAQKLILCTSSNGFLNHEKQLIPYIPKIDETILSYIDSGKSTVGLGGMLSKITFTRLATGLGIDVFITGLAGNSPIQKTLNFEKGSYFKASKSTLKARQKWLMSGSVTAGSIVIDAGAEKALHARKSLLTVGIVRTEGEFAKDQVVQLITEQGDIIGVAKTRLSQIETIQNQQQKNTLAAHANDIVLF